MGRYKFEVGQKVIVTKKSRYAEEYRGVIGVVEHRDAGCYGILVRKFDRELLYWFDTNWLSLFDEPEFNGNI